MSESQLKTEKRYREGTIAPIQFVFGQTSTPATDHDQTHNGRVLSLGSGCALLDLRHPSLYRRRHGREQTKSIGGAQLSTAVGVKTGDWPSCAMIP
jgi:hypothetical protein